MGAPKTLRHAIKFANFQLGKHGNFANVIFPTRSLEDIDRGGQMNAMRLQNRMVLPRLTAYKVPNVQDIQTFFDYDNLSKEQFVFVVCFETKVNRSFYQLRFREEWPSLNIKHELGRIGTTSTDILTTMYEAESNDPLATCSLVMACVDRETRKLSAFPDWWKQKFANATVGMKKLIVPKIVPPKETFNSQMTVQWCDVGLYWHTNYNYYIRYCLDAAMVNMQRGQKYKMFRGDICDFNVDKFRMLYLSETMAGDVMDIHSWEDVEDPYTLHFDAKQGNDPIFQSSFKFYDPEEK